MRKCPYCQSQIEENAKFCLYCMKELEEKAEETTGVVFFTKKKIALIILSAVLLLTIAISLPIAIGNLPSKDSQGEKTDRTETTAALSETVESQSQTVPQTGASGSTPTTVGDPNSTTVSGTNTGLNTGANPNSATNSGTQKPTQNSSAAPNSGSNAGSTQKPASTQAPTEIPTEPPFTLDNVSSPASKLSSDTLYYTNKTGGSNPPTYWYTIEYRDARASDVKMPGVSHVGKVVITNIEITSNWHNTQYYIPAALDGKEVCAIMSNAFAPNTAPTVEWLVVSAQNLTVHDYAFSGCINFGGLTFQNNDFYLYPKAFANSGTNVKLCCKENAMYGNVPYKEIVEYFGAVNGN